MRNYDYREKWEKLLTPRVVRYLTTIHEYRGEQRVIAARYADILKDLIETAKIQSAESSNKIEGIYTSDERLKKIILDKTMPKSRNEQEIAGYRDVLNTIHESNEHIPVRSTFILQLHRELYKFEDAGIGGIFKCADSIPVSVGKLCEAYHYAVDHTEADPLLIIAMFILDFLCIHPFKDGNGRMSRLLTILLLYKSDYNVGRYISIERLIETTKNSYYTALQESSDRWHEGENDYEPFVIYLLDVITAAYREFFERTKFIEEKKMAKPDRVEEEIKNTIGTITKTELMERVTGVSQTTIQRTLTELVKQKKIKKIGNGRYTKYVWNREDEQ